MSKPPVIRAVLILGFFLGILTACGTDYLKGTPTPADLVAQALADTKNLTRYHYTTVVTHDGPMASGTIMEGDWVAPDQLYMRAYISPTLTPVAESLSIGNTYYIKQGDSWATPAPVPTPLPTVPSESFPSGDYMLFTFDYGTGNSVTGTILDLLSRADHFAEVGTETLNVADVAATPVPVVVWHLTYTLDPARRTPGQDTSIADSATGGSIYIDPATGHLYRFTMDVDLQRMWARTFATAEAKAGAGLRGLPNLATPIPRFGAKETWIYTLTRHNDPAITVPTP